MAPLSPRRSSRARATTSQSQQSSNSSSNSIRVDRPTRSANKPASGKTTPSASLSSEPPEDLDDTPLPRRRKRGQDDDPEKPAFSELHSMANGVDDLQDEEDESVRCICGFEEYPGRPLVEGPEAEFFAGVDLTDDLTGFFLQCDVCKVWQHGACVGIFSAEGSPEEYFCEQCRKDLHRVHVATNGQKYSKYVPVNGASRATSRAASAAKGADPKSPKPPMTKSQRQTREQQLAKRRSTMNSRDAAYGDELLRRAIEASKEEAPEGESSVRRTKRGRSDSEDNASNVKRQRTHSRSPSPIAQPDEPPSREESEDESAGRSGSRKTKATVNTTAKPVREGLEKDEKERQRQEAANKRKGRAERRRAEDSEPAEDLSLAVAKVNTAATNKSVESPTIPELPAPIIANADTPPPAPVTGPSPHKKSVRSHHKKVKGRNQHTKDREMDHEESPARSMSRDIHKPAEEPATSTATKASAGEAKANSKSKTSMPTKMTMTDMKRRVAAIMDFISRTQVDLAAEESILQSGDEKRMDTLDRDAHTAANGVNEANGMGGHDQSSTDFKDLNCMEMMDVLTRDMVKWQNQYT